MCLLQKSMGFMEVAIVYIKEIVIELIFGIYIKIRL